jgi:hypothetical protein
MDRLGSAEKLLLGDIGDPVTVASGTKMVQQIFNNS